MVPPAVDVVGMVWMRSTSPSGSVEPSSRADTLSVSSAPGVTLKASGGPGMGAVDGAAAGGGMGG